MSSDRSDSDDGDSQDHPIRPPRAGYVASDLEKTRFEWKEALAKRMVENIKALHWWGGMNELNAQKCLETILKEHSIDIKRAKSGGGDGADKHKGKWAWVEKVELGELPEKVKHLEGAMYAFKPEEWDTIVKVVARILAGGKEVLEDDEVTG
ncbi:hypothetical protein BGX38DRAFT_1269480 [Terfezia claveryi]|nr:hypothetical protein BGX38DRAFT_1269480 [Terfezia claveryi]